MKKSRWRQIVGLLALVAIGLALVVRTERVGEAACVQLRERLPAAIGADVSIGRCEIDPLTLTVKAQKVVVRLKDAAEPLVSADEALVSLRGLFLGGVALQEVRLVRPQVDVELQPPPPDGAPPVAVAGCALEPLRRIRVTTLRIDDGRVRLRRGERELLLEGVSVHASLGRRDGELNAFARGGSVRLDAERLLRLGRLTLEGSIDLGGAQLELQRVEANVEGLSVSLSGQLEGLCDAMPQISANGQVFVPIDALARLFPALPTPSGQVWSRVSLAGRLDALTARADLTATQVKLGVFTPGDFSARAVLSDNKVVLEEFLTRSGEGEVRLSGELALTEGLPVKVKLDIKDASFARILSRASVPGSWVEFPASVKGALTGHLAPMPSLGGDVEFHTGKFLLASRAWDANVKSGVDILHFAQSAGTFHFTFSDRGAAFEDIALSVGADQRTRVHGQVRLNPFDVAHFIDITAGFDSLDLSDFGAIAELPWSGQGTLSGTIRGSQGHVKVDAQTSLRDFKLDGYSLGVAQTPIRFEGETLSFPTVVAQKGQTQYFGDVALDFLSTGLHARATVQLPDGRVEDVVDLLADLSPATISTLQDGVLTGRVSALAAIDSPAKELTGVIAMKVANVELLQRRVGAADVVLRFDHGQAMVLEPLVFDGPLGHLTAAGRWAFSGPLAFDLLLENGVTAELMDPKGLDGTSVGGTFTSKAKVGGDTDTILVDGTLASDDVTWKARSLGPMHLDGRLVGREFSTIGTVFPGVKGTAKVSFRDDLPYQTALQLDLDDLSPFLPASAGLTGRAHGTLVASGPYRALKQSKAAAALELLTVARGEVSATNSAPVELAYTAGAFEVHSLAMKGPTTEFEAQGSWGPSTVNLTSRGSVDLRLLSSFLSAVERTQGRLDFTAAFSGPVKSPALVGNAEVNDVRFTVKGQDLAVKSLTGRADFSESRVLISDVQGFANDGRVRMRGDVRLDRLALKSVELQTDFEDVTMQVVPEVPATFSGSLLATTRGAGLWQLQGALDVQKLRYTQPLALDSLLASAKKGVPSDEKPEEWLKLDVDLTAGNDVRIENNLARAKLLGKIKLSGTNVKPVLIGSIEAGVGAQAFFRGNTFQVTRGQLQFNGLWPTFDLSAQSQVRDYLVSVKAFGRIEDPKISLSSEPGLPDTDVLSLLTLGVTSRERLSGQSGASLAAEALLSASGLDQQVQRFLSQNVGLKDQQVRLTTSFNEATGTAEPSVTWESKVASDDLKVGVTQPVTGRGTKAQLEYRFNQRVSGRFQWDNQNQNTSIGNPGVDLRFRFEWE